MRSRKAPELSKPPELKKKKSKKSKTVRSKEPKKSMKAAKPGKAGQPAAPKGELRRVVNLLTRYSGGRRLYLGALALLVCEAVTAIYQPYPIAYLIDFFRADRPPIDLVDFSWLSSPRAETLLILTLGLVLLTMVNSLADSMAEITLARGGRTLGYNTREALYGRLHRLSLAFHGHRRTGDMLTRVTSDVGAVEDFVIDSVSDLAGSFLVLIGTVAFLFYKSWQVAIVALLIVPLLSLISNFFSQRIKAASKKLRAREGDLASIAQEMLSSIRVIQTYGRSRYEEERFAEQSRSSMEAALEAASLKARFSWVVAVLEAVAISAVAWIGLVLIDRRTITVGTLVLFVILIQNMFKPTRKIIREWTLIGKIFAAVERIAEVLDREASVRDRPDAVPAPPFRGELAFRDVAFAYQLDPEDVPEGTSTRRVALRGVSFDVSAGQVVALVGASGAGKSTIAQLIPRLYDPDEGSVRIDGRDVREFTLDSLRNQVSMVLQETVLFSGTVAQNIAYGREDADNSDVVEAAIKAQAHPFILELPQGYDTVLGERGANLSGGQRQRIAIARAFVRNAPILILDEPTTGLDSASAEQVILGLESLMKGKTTIIISHDLHLVRAADLVLVLQNGKIVQSGTHRSLVAVSGPYADFCRRQGLILEPAASRPAELEAPGAAFVPPLVVRTGLEAPRHRRRYGRARSYGPELQERLSGDRSASSARPETGAPPGRSSDADTNGAPTNGAASKGAAAEGAEGKAAPAHGAARNGAEAGGPADLNPLASPLLHRALPGLRSALDPAVMARQLQRYLFENESGSSITECRPGKAMFLGGGGVSLRYQLKVSDASTGETRDELVLGRLFSSGQQAADYRRGLAPLVAAMEGHAEARSFTTLCATPPAVPGLVVHAFPVDADLPTLVAATDPDQMLGLFAKALRRTGLTVHRCSVELGHYGRRDRCVLRYCLDVSSAGSGRTGKAVVYGKVYADDTGALVADVVPSVSAHLASSRRPPVAVPSHLTYLSDLRLSLLNRLPGEPVVAAAVKAACQGRPPAEGRPTADEAMDDAARVAASMHQWPVSTTPLRTLGADLAELRSQVAEMSTVSPELAHELQSVLEDIELAAVRTNTQPVGFAHGDYSLAQLLHAGDWRADAPVGLVDFDSACQAEPALDLGHFTAYLRMGVAKNRATTETGGRLAERLTERFLATYAAEAGPLRLDGGLWDRVAVYEAVSLLRITIHAWQKLKPERTRMVLFLLRDGVARLP